MKKKISVVLFTACVLWAFCIVGCEKNTEKGQSPYEGKWVAVSA